MKQLKTSHKVSSCINLYNLQHSNNRFRSHLPSMIQTLVIWVLRTTRSSPNGTMETPSVKKSSWHQWWLMGQCEVVTFKFSAKNISNMVLLSLLYYFPCCSLLPSSWHNGECIEVCNLEIEMPASSRTWEMDATKNYAHVCCVHLLVTYQQKSTVWCKHAV